MKFKQDTFILLVSFFIALFTRSLLITGLTGELKKRGIGIAQGVADSARVFMLTKNQAELTAIAYDAKLGKRKDIIKYLMISDKQGNILAHTFTTGFPPNIKSLVKNQNIETENINSIRLVLDDSFSIDRWGIALLMKVMPPLKHQGISIDMENITYNYARVFKMAGMDKMATLKEALHDD